MKLYRFLDKAGNDLAGEVVDLKDTSDSPSIIAYIRDKARVVEAFIDYICPGRSIAKSRRYTVRSDADFLQRK